MNTLIVRAARAALLLALTAAAGAGCSDTPTTPDEGAGGGASPVTVSASLTAEQQAIISGLSVEVSGPGIDSPIVANISVVGATVNGTVQVPAGSNRTFVVRAFDAGGVETHRGSASATVRAGTNVTLAVQLLPLAGGAPIAVTVGTFTIAITPGTPLLGVGSTRTLTATVSDANGVVAAPGIQWGSSNPVVAPLTPNGQTATVTGGILGTTTVVASYRGMTAAVTVRITGGASSISIGGSQRSHVCAVVGAGDAYCWGVGDQYQLGTGANVSATAPRRVVASGVAFNTVSAGGDGHSCALATSGAAYCWGFNNQGQTGAETQESVTAPTAVVGGLAFTSVAVGEGHSCGLTQAGAAHCWGYNAAGELGDGTITDRGTPTPVAGGHAFTSISAGSYFTCALTAAGAARCWGGMMYGSTLLTPTAVAGAPAFVAIAGGDGHACAVTPAGAAYCWGNGFSGQLGAGAGIDSSSRPVSVNGGIAFSAIAAGQDFSCGVGQSSGAAYCWGANAKGQLGDGTTAARSAPTAVAGGLTFAAIAAGGQTACGITTAGALYCWGDNQYGKVGDGTTTNRTAPTPVVFP